jgi:osmoprotectant transport system ATP-binding protein
MKIALRIAVLPGRARAGAIPVSALPAKLPLRQAIGQAGAVEIRFEAVGKWFGEAVALDAVSARVAPGSFVALVGASGSGKSTLLKTVNRLIQPDRGRVLLDGQDVAAASAPALRRRIGYVFQNVGLFPHMDVAANVAIGLRLEGRAPGDRVAELLALVGLDPAFATRMPDQLSGGQRQRVGVARALALAPGLVLMDEPFGALDPVTRDAIGRSYRALHARLGLTTLMVTHDMAEALLLADRVLVMAAGRLVGDGTPAELLADAAGPEAAALVAVPRDQAARLKALEP